MIPPCASRYGRIWPITHVAGWPGRSMRLSKASGISGSDSKSAVACSVAPSVCRHVRQSRPRASIGSSPVISHQRSLT